jgi:hypothetical protein
MLTAFITRVGLQYADSLYHACRLTVCWQPLRVKSVSESCCSISNSKCVVNGRLHQHITHHFAMSWRQQAFWKHFLHCLKPERFNTYEVCFTLLQSSLVNIRPYLWRQFLYINLLSLSSRQRHNPSHIINPCSCYIFTSPLFLHLYQIFSCHMKTLVWQWFSHANCVMEWTFVRRLLPCAHFCAVAYVDWLYEFEIYLSTTVWKSLCFSTRWPIEWVN